MPIGGWGRIVLQTVLLAEQRGQTFAGRVILDRLHALVSERDARSILVEISLGVFVESLTGSDRLTVAEFSIPGTDLTIPLELDLGRLAGSGEAA